MTLRPLSLRALSTAALMAFVLTVPSTSHAQNKCDAGKLLSYTSHSIIGIHKPLRSFHIDYTKQ